MLATGFISLLSLNSYAVDKLPSFAVEDTPSSYSNINIYNSDEVRYLFNKMSEALIKEYNHNKTKNLAFEMLDASDTDVLQFYNKVTHRENNNHLALDYFANFKIDGENVPACFVFYDPTKKIFTNYMQQGFTQEEAFSYLTVHEFAHCLFASRGVSVDSRGNEILADLFAVAHSMNLNKYKQVVKIIKLNKVTNSAIHQNAPFLENFFLMSNDNNLFSTKKTPDELVDIVFSYFKNHFQEHIIALGGN